MTTIYEQLTSVGWQEGYFEGRQEGIQKGLLWAAKRMLQANIPANKIVRILQLSLAEIESIQTNS